MMRLHSIKYKPSATHDDMRQCGNWLAARGCILMWAGQGIYRVLWPGGQRA